MRKLRVAVIGCGPIGQLHGRAVQASPRAVLVAACDPIISKARLLSPNAYRDAGKMLAAESPDVVTIATPDHLHVQPVLESLAAGCHVFCEKPLASSSSEVERIVQTAKKHRRFVGVDYNRRFGFGYLKATELLKKQALGKILHVVIHVTDGLPPARVTRQPQALLKSLLSHHIDLMWCFCGDIASVRSAFGHDESQVTLSFRFRNGATGSIVGGWRRGQTRTWESATISGTKGILHVKDVMKEVQLWRHDPDRIEQFRPSFWKCGNRFYDSLTVHVASFLEHISRGQTPPVTAEDGLRGSRIIEAAVKNAQK